MNNNITTKNDLIELKDFLEQKYGIKVFLSKSNINNIEKIEYVFLKLFALIVFILIIVIIYYRFKKYINIFLKKNFFINIIFYILLIIISLRLFYLLQSYIYKICFYNTDNNKYDKYSINYKNINFETGDILHEVVGWNNDMGFWYYLFQTDFLHCIFVINFNNKNYILHYRGDSFGYPENILSFNNKHLEICLLDDYFMDKYNTIKYYRVYKPKKKN